MTNKKMGNNFESDFCETLADNGFWAHNMAQNASGQPADVIACSKFTTALIDCKVCTTNKFLFSRVEDNQWLAMTMFEECTNNKGWFAIKFTNPSNVFMLDFDAIKYLKAQGNNFVTRDILPTIGYTLSGWICEFS